MRQIGAGDIQRLIAEATAEGLAAKTIRNLWGTLGNMREETGKVSEDAVRRAAKRIRPGKG
jgi:hypothetical protein